MIPLVRVLRSRDHQDAVRGQVGVDGLRLAALWQDVLAKKVSSHDRGPVLGLLLVRAFHRQDVIRHVDLQLVGPVLVGVKGHLELRLVLLDPHQLTALTNVGRKIPSKPEGRTHPTTGWHEPWPEIVLVSFSNRSFFGPIFWLLLLLSQFRSLLLLSNWLLSLLLLSLLFAAFMLETVGTLV